MSARGFTLIEALIATALGAVIATVAFSGIRIASQSVALANRLSLENGLMREGYLVADEQVDTWTWNDDPDAPASGRPLRAVDGDGRGLAFTPLRDTPWRYQAASDRERQRGWDPANPWSPADPATWWRGDMAEKAAGDMRHGRYALFAHVDGAGPVDSDYGAAVPVAHAWLYGQMRGLLTSLGYYGGCEYLGGNVVYGWYENRADGLTTLGGIPRWLVAASSNPSSFTNDDGGQETVRGLYRLTFVTQFALPAVSSTQTVGDRIAADRRWWLIAGPGQFDDWKNGTGVGRGLLPLHPSHWPDVRVTINRAIKNRRFIAMSFVGLESPVTGQRIEFSFSTFGTSLRGARQQRRPDGGWARWDNAVGAINDPTLDSP